MEHIRKMAGNKMQNMGILSYCNTQVPNDPSSTRRLGARWKNSRGIRLQHSHVTT